MPTLFILPKSLSELSPYELEKIVLKSQATLTIPSPVIVGEPHQFNIPNTKVAAIELIPGGRWLLAGCTDGSVWCYDLGSSSNKSPDPAGLLLASPLSSREGVFQKPSQHRILCRLHTRTFGN
jgi:hypothetical protein